MDDFFRLYDTLAAGIPAGLKVTGTLSGSWWTAVETADFLGMAMTTSGDTVPPLFSTPYTGMELTELAKAAKSWNLTEASHGVAAMNAFYNTPHRLETLHAHAEFDQYCTHGLDLQGKRIGVVGHLNMPDFVREQASELLILERSPRPGDYPDSACEWLLPACDIVLITGSALVNKTLPRLLQLCGQAYTILTGPTVPLCPDLLKFGIDRIAGLVITNQSGMHRQIQTDLSGPPYPHGRPFLLTRDDL